MLIVTCIITTSKALSWRLCAKNGREYRLAPKGLRYVDRLSLKHLVSPSAKTCDIKRNTTRQKWVEC